ncbi:MAG TPA: ComF family protein [Firmicutes bacterium]|nr:ComF family protein [Candidatus Fermentithermobacillaceae bacterium]
MRIFGKVKLEGIRSRLKSLGDAVTGLMYGQPSECALCGEVTPRSKTFPFLTRRNGGPDFSLDTPPGICESCLDKLSRQMSWVCEVCGAPLRPPLPVCPDCQKCLYLFDGQRSAGIYEGYLKSAIIRMKYQGERWLSRPLGWLVARAALEFMPLDIVVPIPVEPGSRIRRGYNQALDLAKEVSGLLEIPLLDILARDKRYSHQVDLGRKMRWRNLQESMVATCEINLRGQRCLLVDDVTTTGATLDEAARVLKKLGAEKVYCATVARTLRH